MVCLGAAALARSLPSFDPDPVSATQVSAKVSGAKAFARSCTEHSSKALLENVGTADTVRDLDRIRAALGQSKLNYLGFSYGTYLGELYDEEYPSHVRAMVLDGVVDPALSSTAWNEQRAAALEGDLRISSRGAMAARSAGSGLRGGAARNCPKGLDRLITSSWPGWPMATGPMLTCRPGTVWPRK